MNFFLDSDGVTDSLRRSVYVAVHHALSRARDRHAGGLRDRALHLPRRRPVPARAREHARVPAHHPRRPARGHVPPLVGIDDTVYGVALAHVALTLPFAVLVTASVFAGISYELEEAAMTLGCSRFSAFRKVALPLALPGLAAAAIFVFIISWNEVFAAALLTLREPDAARADARRARRRRRCRTASPAASSCSRRRSS